MIPALMGLSKMPTLGNPQKEQEAQKLAALMEQYRQLQGQHDTANQMRQTEYVNDSGALGALAVIANKYMGGKIDRKANETAQELTQRIIEAQTSAEQQALQQQQQQKLMEEQRIMQQRKQQTQQFKMSPEQAMRWELEGKLGNEIGPPAELRTFEAMTAGLPAAERERARRVQLGLDPRASRPEFQLYEGADGPAWLQKPTGQPVASGSHPNEAAVIAQANEMVAKGMPPDQIDAFVQKSLSTNAIPISGVRPKSPQKPTVADQKSAKAPQINNVIRGLDRIDKALAGLDGALVDTGPIDQYLVGRMPSGQELEAAVGGIQNSMLALTRVPGMGAQSDLEAKIAALQYPSLDKPPEVNRKTLENLRAFVAELQDVYGSGQQPAAQPQASDEARRKALLDKY